MRSEGRWSSIQTNWIGFRMSDQLGGQANSDMMSTMVAANVGLGEKKCVELFCPVK